MDHKHALTMLVRSVLKALRGHHHLRLTNTYIRSQNCSFDALSPCVDVKNLQSRNMIDKWIHRLKKERVPEAELSVKFITEHVLGKDRAGVSGVRENSQNLTREEIKKINKLCHQRLQRVPVQYIIGEWEFRHLTLSMEPPVFIPRPETEELIDLVAKHHVHDETEGSSFSFLEIGCGSGAICLSILTEFSEATCVAIDKNKAAVNLTRHNANRCNVSDRIELHHADVQSVLPLLGSRKFDVIISNPPYIPLKDMALLQPEISRYEDEHALCGGPDGLDVVKDILRVSPMLLKPTRRSSVWLEVDISHPTLIDEWISGNDLGLKYSATFNDFTRRPRFCHITRK